MLRATSLRNRLSEHFPKTQNRAIAPHSKYVHQENQNWFAESAVGGSISGKASSIMSARICWPEPFVSSHEQYVGHEFNGEHDILGTAWVCVTAKLIPRKSLTHFFASLLIVVARLLWQDYSPSGQETLFLRNLAQRARVSRTLGLYSKRQRVLYL
jgi:hypothetical protein